MPQRAPTTVDDWLRSLPPERAQALGAVRDAIRRNLPKGYEEALGKEMLLYQVPLARYPETYNGHPLWLAALGAPKSYLTLHLMPVYGSPEAAQRLAAGFAKAGKKLNIGKACIRFTRIEDLALDAIGEVIASMPVDRWVAIAEAAWPRRSGKRVRKPPD